MEKNKILLKILTPSRVVYNKPVDMFIVRTDTGDMGVLYGHEPYSAMLDYGAVRVYQDGQEQKEELLMILGGNITIKDNEAVIMSDMAEPPEKIQESIQKLVEERAAHKIQEQDTHVNIRQMELAIRRALVNMDISAYSILKEHSDIQDD
jgi:F-type H+-transporting ATPase subunit epsilon